MRVQVLLPFVRETPGTVVYSVPNIKSQAVGQVYVNKDHLEKVNGQWPGEITVTVEPGNTIEEQA